MRLSMGAASVGDLSELDGGEAGDGSGCIVVGSRRAVSFYFWARDKVVHAGRACNSNPA
jgi:hypothetical protein